MDDRRTARIAVRAGVENTVSGVGEEVDEGVEFNILKYESFNLNSLKRFLIYGL